MVNPLTVDIALWYYVRTVDYGKGVGDNNFNAPAVQAAFRLLCEHGLLERGTRDGQVYAGTKALEAWVNAICSVPFPVQEWVIPKLAAQDPHIETILMSNLFGRSR